MAKSLKIWHRYLLVTQVVFLFTLSIKLWLGTNVPNQALFNGDYAKVEIATWQNISQKSLNQGEIKDIVSGNFRGGVAQRFTRQEQILTLELATFSESNGDLKKYLKKYSDNLFAITQYEAYIGNYALFLDNERLTMTACLTESGQTTITADQFKVAQIRAAFNMRQFWRWLTNQDQLIPHTCRWRSLSISPVTPDTNEILLNTWLVLNKTGTF